MEKTFDIKEELKKLPDAPGVYIMHDKDDVIIYIGKAKSLTKRVHQYFQASQNEKKKKKAAFSVAKATNNSKRHRKR